jgi:hypothetical protein
MLGRALTGLVAIGVVIAGERYQNIVRRRIRRSVR